MNFLEHLASFLVALALLALVSATRRSSAPQRFFPDARELGEELRAPQIALAAFLCAWLWLYFHSSVTALNDLQSIRISQILVHTLGGIALLRLGDIAVFAFLRLRGVAPSKIVRSVVVWVCTAVVIGAGARKAWLLDLGSLLTTSALLSVVLGFALQEPLGNLFAGLTLNAEHPFEPGDWISFDKFTGRVLDVGWRSTRLVSEDEDELLVPNGFISRAVVINHSRPSTRRVSELQMTIDMEASPAEVKKVLLETARSVPGVLAVPSPTAQIVRFEDDGVLWKLRIATTSYSSNDDVRDRLQQALWYALRRGGHDLPHKQLSIYRRERPADAEARRRREHFTEAEELLGRIDFVAALKPEARKELARAARFLEYGPGEAVVRQGEVGEEFFLVAHGELTVHVEGREKEVARLTRGDFFGEVALLTGELRTATVVAVESAALLAVDREAFARLFANDEGVMEELARAIAGRKAQLATAREQLDKGAAPSPEASNLLSRIRGIFAAQLRRPFRNP